jgi:hypothetical protein
MMISMNAKKNIVTRPGIALLIVLFIVMTIAIVSLGFLSRSDVELACGENMILRTQMDYLAESGLEHARGLILNPQDIASEDWTGIHTELQLVNGSSDYYDVTVVRDANDRCNYIIDCNSYRLEGTEKIGRSSLKAELRLDPCIAYWVGSTTEISPQIAINGDVYCGDTLTNNGDINGDVFAAGTIIGTGITRGQKNESVASIPVDWPGFDVNDFSSNYYIDSASYLVEVIDPNISNSAFGPSGNNPAGIHYCNEPNDPANLGGNVTINGTLVVNGDLTIRGTDNVISAVKNFPALLVNGQVIMEDGASLMIQGLAQIGQGISIDAGAASADIRVIGGLFIDVDGITSNLVSVDVTAAPAIASIETWPTAGTARKWCPAAGAFFKSIERR